MSRSLLPLLASLPLLAAGAESNAIPPVYLRQGWAIRSSADVGMPPGVPSGPAGAALSTPAYDPRGWYPATLPSTVLHALVESHVYPDPYFGMNLRSIPGASYPISTNFSNLQMPPDSPFRHSWWYRASFQLDATYKGKTVWLGFDGINFRANVWLNGRQIADSSKMAGAWRLYQFDVTAAARPGEANVLAVEVFPPTPHDLSITFVDWNPQPPDKNMGLWRDVWVAATGPVAIRFPTVTTKLAGSAADLTVRTELTNASGSAVAGVLDGQIEDRKFSQTVRLGAGETRVVHATLKLDHPRLWWPAQVGEQNLSSLDLQFSVDGQVSDASQTPFGVREVTSEIDAQGHRLFHINGKNILIRGGGYTFDMLLHSTPERQEAELKYVRDMNLNALRFEGKLEDEHFLRLSDRMGIMLLAGWCCCDYWERWPQWTAEDRVVASESLRDQLRRLAPHPAVIDWMYGSDNPPPPKVEQVYLDIIKEVEWPNPFHSSATAKPTPLGGPTGVKMTGPYEYIAPGYWLLDTTRGGAHGFNTETSPGPAPLPIESLRRMLPPDKLWPINAAWDYHAGGGEFKNIHVFSEALNARYGTPATVEDFARKAQMMAYEGHRAMFEAFGRNKYTATGVIQWMLNNAWPSLIWHLYDWYLRPGGSYFGAKKANEPLHVQYSYDDRSVVVVNSFYKPFRALKAAAKIYNLDMSVKFAKDAILDVTEDSTTRVFTIPEIAGLSATYFVNLTLTDAAGAEVSRNFYWLSTTPETLNWNKSNWYYTPTKTFADYTALNTLPRTDLKIDSATRQQGADRITTVTVTNAGPALAFGVHLKVNKGADGDEVLPVLWDGRTTTSPCCRARPAS
ncbi:MAG: glycoside hydrolase family 2 protein [Bryobacteraceae bacterium]